MSTNLPGEGFNKSLQFSVKKCINIGSESEYNIEFGADKECHISVKNEHRSSRGNYLRQYSRYFLTDLYLTILLLFVIFSSCTANFMGEHCDWSGK